MRALMSRRSFLQSFALVAGLSHWSRSTPAGEDESTFQISLHERALVKMVTAGQLDHLDLARVARTQLGLSAVEYASSFFAEKVKDEAYLTGMNERAAEHKIRQLLITVDTDGRVGAPDPKQRKEFVRHHHRWVDAAEILGCHSIEVGISSAGTPDEQLERVAEGMAMLCEYADKHHINVLAGCRDCPDVTIEWFLKLMKTVDHPVAGVLPTFALLATAKDTKEIAALMPFAKGMSAANDPPTESGTAAVEFSAIVPRLVRCGYRGYVGIGCASDSPEGLEGIRKVIARLEAARSTSA